MADDIDWSSYVPYVPIHEGSWRDLTAAQARESYKDWLVARDERKTELGKLLSQAGLALSASYTGLQQVEDWLTSRIEAGSEFPDLPAPRWYAVVNDVAIFLGDSIVEKNPNLHWSLQSKSKKFSDSQKPVIKGFSKVTYPHYAVDLVGLVQSFAERSIQKRDDLHGYLVRLFRDLEESA